jgi:putative aminopeptidase FrvX
LKGYFSKFCDEVRIDRIGNCIGKINGTNSNRPKSYGFGHMDQLGFIVRKIEKGGRLYTGRSLGGIPEKSSPGF